jgi:BirA family biotin operon repressor/biotin-[acetyl-CoA-carboxylase] ligase
LRLGASATEQGYRLETLGSVASTNDEAMARARAGDRGRLWIVAESQSGGRGRQGRTWVSPPGNLYASLLLVDPCENARAAELGFVAGVALAEAARAVLGAVEGLGLKWPNDLVRDGAKLSGMLLEAARMPDGVLATVVGIGVNCATHPGDLAYATTSLDELLLLSGGRRERQELRNTREAMFEHLSDALARWLKVWRRGENFAAIREAWLSNCAGLGRPIRVARADAIVEGTFRTIDATGRLIVATAQGDIAIDAGDVLLPGARL